jgi:hypothetical protein
VSGRGRGGLVPNIVDKLLDRHALACTKEQRREHGPLLSSAKLHCTITDPGLERPQQLEPDMQIVARAPS